MPNWCSTTYKFHGTLSELLFFNYKIKEWISKSFTKTDFRDSWLGNILHGAGLEDRIDNPDENLRLACRGTILDITSVELDPYGNCYFEIYTETAWTPMPKMWLETIKALNLTSVNFSFCSEEVGCDLYWIYDPYNYGDFSDIEIAIDAFYDGNDEDIRYKFVGINDYYREEDAIKVLQEFFDTNEDSLETLISYCNDFTGRVDDAYISVHEFERINEIYE